MFEIFNIYCTVKMLFGQLLFYCKGKLLLGKLVIGEISNREIVVAEIGCWGSCPGEVETWEVVLGK